MIFDSHIHITEIDKFTELVKNKQLGVLVNASSVAEYEELLKLKGAYISFGIHPWSAYEFYHSQSLTGLHERIARGFSSLRPCFLKADVIGEIGMDSVWCQCDLEVQRQIFIAQLDMAEELGKPVVLHTKGQEEEISEILKHYTMKKLIHWYSCEEHLAEYIKQGCYFTIGPDFQINRSVQVVIRQVPVDRLLVETDGISAVEWAIAKMVSPVEIPEILGGAIKAIAKVKQMTVKVTEAILEENFYRFVEL